MRRRRSNLWERARVGSLELDVVQFTKKRHESETGSSGWRKKRSTSSDADRSTKKFPRRQAQIGASTVARNYKLRISRRSLQSQSPQKSLSHLKARLKWGPHICEEGKQLVSSIFGFLLSYDVNGGRIQASRISNEPAEFNDNQRCPSSHTGICFARGDAIQSTRHPSCGSGVLHLILLGLRSRRISITMLNIAQSLLWINITMLFLKSAMIIDMGLSWLDLACEDLLDFFQGLSCSLRIVSS